MAPGDNEACPVGAVCGDDVRCSSGSLFLCGKNLDLREKRNKFGSRVGPFGPML